MFNCRIRHSLHRRGPAGSSDTGQEGRGPVSAPHPHLLLLPHPLVPTSQVTRGTTLNQEAHRRGHFVERVSPKKGGGKRRTQLSLEGEWMSGQRRVRGDVAFKVWGFGTQILPTPVLPLSPPFPESHSKQLSGLVRTALGNSSLPSSQQGFSGEPCST